MEVIFELPASPVVAPTRMSVPAFEFYRRITFPVRQAIRALAVTDPIAFDFMHTLDLAVADKRNVNSDDDDLVGGLAYFQAYPAGTPCMTAALVATLFA